jgi:hypothetical protein
VIAFAHQPSLFDAPVRDDDAPIPPEALPVYRDATLEERAAVSRAALRLRFALRHLAQYPTRSWRGPAPMAAIDAVCADPLRAEALACAARRLAYVRYPEVRR